MLPVRFHRIAPGRVAVESAFCEHLRSLRAQLAPRFQRLRVAAPTMDPAAYARDRGHLGTLDEHAEGIEWTELWPGHASSRRFWLRHFLPVLRTLWREVRRAELVHAGISHNLWRPFEVASLAMAALLRRRSICVVDIDLRQEARMSYLTGRWSRKSLFLCNAIYDPLRRLQLRFAVRACSLVLLKGRKLCRDFGAGRPNVRYFLDSAYASEHVIPEEALERKLEALRDPARPLELVYFGRLTAYKGVDRCIEAVALASRRSAKPIVLHVIGAGEEEAVLRRHAARLGVGANVRFHGALPFGPGLFEALYPMHLALAAPLSEDTPRSALDALACGTPIAAFDTEYYSDLASSGAVSLVPWPSVERLADCIDGFARDKQRLIPLARKAVEFARDNTQEAWLRARIDWTLAACGEPPRAAPRVREVSTAGPA